MLLVCISWISSTFLTSVSPFLFTISSSLSLGSVFLAFMLSLDLPRFLAPVFSQYILFSCLLPFSFCILDWIAHPCIWRPTFANWSVSGYIIPKLPSNGSNLYMVFWFLIEGEWYSVVLVVAVSVEEWYLLKQWNDWTLETQNPVYEILSVWWADYAIENAEFLFH